MREVLGAGAAGGGAVGGVRHLPGEAAVHVAHLHTQARPPASRIQLTVFLTVRTIEEGRVRQGGGAVLCAN